MLNVRNTKLSSRLVLGVFVTIVIVCCMVKSADAFSYDEYWITPFESVITTEYNLGNGFTAKSTATSVTTIVSVRHSDERVFSADQWTVILSGIADGSIAWED